VLNKIFLNCAGCVLQCSRLNKYRSYSQHTSSSRPALWLHFCRRSECSVLPICYDFRMGFFASIAEQVLSLHMYLLLKLTTVLPPYQSVRTNTLHEHQFHRQQSVVLVNFLFCLITKLNTFLLGRDMLLTK
jgi:hypothetical protein